MKKKTTLGFTLFELSIVLVIIGLITGGILVGQELIKGAAARAQVAQIEKYHAAVNSFQNKYGGLPGDLNVNLASQFGFTVGTGCDGSANGMRDGDGHIDGQAPSAQYSQMRGETELFWVDLSSVNSIDGQFPNSGAATPICGATTTTRWTTAPGTAYIGDYLPMGKIGYGTFVYVYDYNQSNWFGLSQVTVVETGGGLQQSQGSIPPAQAYAIDKKIDDGFPATGGVIAQFLFGSNSTPPVQATNGSADTASTCYNNVKNTYSINVSGGLNATCGLSFQFQ